MITQYEKNCNIYSRLLLQLIMKERIFKYDFIRAFAIITVVMSHIFTTFAVTNFEYGLKEYINTILRFSVVIFIFLAGFFFKDVKDLSYLKTKVLRVLVPYSIVSIFATLFLAWKFSWGVDHIVELALSYLFGYQFGYYFILLIIINYIFGYIFVRTNLIKHINKLLLATFILQSIWLMIDESVYRYFNLSNVNFFQFQLNDFFFYRMPLTWLFFFVLGLWYRTEAAKKLVEKYRAWIFALTAASFIILNLQIYFNTGEYTPYGSIIWSVFSTLITLSIVNLNVENIGFKNAINYLSKYSYFIYLIHYFFIYLIIEYARMRGITVPYYLTLVFFPAIMLLSVLITELVKLIFRDKAKAIIGA
jgi:membrane-bound acyltransferase YfiQ involved in biofilm formation